MQNSSKNIKYCRLELPIKTAGDNPIKEKLECFYYLFFLLKVGGFIKFLIQ